MPTITAVELAKRAGMSPEKLRKALRKHKGDSDLAWHHWNDPWIAEMGSDRHKAMERILNEIKGVPNRGMWPIHTSRSIEHPGTKFKSRS